MDVNNQFIIPSQRNSQQNVQERVAPVNKDAEQGNSRQGQKTDQAIVIAPNKEGTDNAKAYQDFIREDSNSYSKNAIASYTSFEKQSQRESVESMFGVDVYA